MGPGEMLEGERKEEGRREVGGGRDSGSSQIPRLPNLQAEVAEQEGKTPKR